jgi:hypothetical protein
MRSVGGPLRDGLGPAARTGSGPDGKGGNAPDTRVRRLLGGYYLVGTPLFLLADLLGGHAVRAAFAAGAPGVRFAYYGVCLLCGLLLLRYPPMARLIALLESGTNVILLIFAVMLTYWSSAEAVAGGATATGLSAEWIGNVILAACVFGFAWMASVARVTRR